MRVCKEVDFHNLMDECWSGAIDTLNTIYDNDKEKELMLLLEENFRYDIPTMTEVNDLLWFDSEWIFETLGINPDDEEDDEDETDF